MFFLKGVKKVLARPESGRSKFSSHHATPVFNPPSAFLLHHLLALSFFVFFSTHDDSSANHPYIRSARSSWCIKPLSFVISRHIIIFLFLLHPSHQDRQEAPTTKPLRQALCRPISTKYFTHSIHTQHSHSHSLSIFSTFVTSHGLPSGCCRGRPLLCLLSLGPGAIKQSSGQWSIWWNNVWRGQPVPRVKPLLFA